MTAPLAFVDCETTGLDADRHEIWEVALTTVDGPQLTDHEWHLPVDVTKAEPIALEIGRFHERWRYAEANSPGRLSIFAAEFARAVTGCHLVGAVISFDEERLRRLLGRLGHKPTWHYHLVDVEALAAGKLGIQPPWDSNSLSAAVGVDPEIFDRHTARGDVLWAKAIYDAVMA